MACALLAALLIGGCGDGSDTADRSPSAVAPSTTAAPTSATSPSVPPEPEYRPPFIDHVEWTTTEQGPSLQVFPTESGRYVPGETELDTAWSEVVAQDATADSPGMRDQFACHWRFARIVEPEKASWNLEPSRPVVTDSEMIATRCNPGGAEESIP